jgi:hypothetical protein
MIMASFFRSDIRASGIAANVRATDPEGRETDAVNVALEHSDAEPVSVFLPYERKRLRGIEYGELFATSSERRVFT